MNATTNSSAAVISLGIADRYVNGTFYVLFGLLGITGNIGVQVAIMTSRVHRRRMSGLFLLNLAIADFLVCSIATPYSIIGVILTPDLPSDHDPLKSEYNSVCKLAMFFTYFTGFLRILSLAAMSVDRYLAINHPYFYSRYCNEDVSKTRRFLAVASLWLVGLVSMIPALISDKMIVFFGYNGRLCGVMWSESTFSYVATTMFINVIFPAIVIIFTNCKVFWLARKQVVRERIKKHGPRRSLSLAIRLRKDSKKVKASASEEKNFGDNLTEMDEIHLGAIDKRLSVVKAGSCRRFTDSTSTMKNPDSALKSNQAGQTQNGETISTERRTTNFLSLRQSSCQISHYENRNTSIAVDSNTKIKSKQKDKKDERRRSSSDWEIALSTLSLVLFYFISYLPFAVTRFLTASSKSTISLQMVAYTMLFTNLGSAINPLIILKTRREFRRNLKKKLCSRNSVDTDVSEWVSKNNQSCN